MTLTDKQKDIIKTLNLGYWVNPRGKRIVVVCDSHTVKRYQGYCVLTATFRQVFEA